MKVDVYKIDGTLTGRQIELNPDVFGIEPNDHAIYLAVKAFLANQRQGTAKTKERSEVRGGGRKPWRQKGRGTARAGSIRSPLWVGGGTVFGPKPRDYEMKIPKKIKTLARLSALTYKAKNNQIIVVEDFQFEQPKTKEMFNILKALKLEDKKTLLLTGSYDKTIYLSGRNIPKLNILEAPKASTYDILNNKVLLLQESALNLINQKFSHE
ncbi:MAG: 50S ribosomal protein L4 [Ignavibacteria bacterium]|nr:50S ribosomal protein L4 [Ignavibacteria bacterium]